MHHVLLVHSSAIEAFQVTRQEKKEYHKRVAGIERENDALKKKVRALEDKMTKNDFKWNHKAHPKQTYRAIRHDIERMDIVLKEAAAKGTLFPDWPDQMITALMSKEIQELRQHNINNANKIAEVIAGIKEKKHSAWLEDYGPFKQHIAHLDTKQLFKLAEELGGVDKLVQYARSTCGLAQSRDDNGDLGMADDESGESEECDEDEMDDDSD